MMVRILRRVTLAVLLAGILAPAAQAQPAKLEILDLGALSLRDLRPGTLTIFNQQRIINASVHRRFRIRADSGTFRYASDDVTVLSGRIFQLQIEGYIYFKNADDIGSMVVEKRDDIRFILQPDKYSLPRYGGGTVTLTQKQVWVGNSTPIDLLKRTGQIYFRTAGANWNGIRATLDAPATSFIVDAAAEDPQQGVMFEFDLSTAKLSLKEGRFRSQRIAAEPAATQKGDRSNAELAAITGPVRLDVSSRDGLSVSAPRLGVRVRSSSLTADDLAVVADGTATLNGFSSGAALEGQRIRLTNASVTSAQYEPDARVNTEASAWASPPLAGLLGGIGLSDPSEIRKAAIAEARETLSALGSDLVFVSVRRALLESIVKERLAATKALSVRALNFGWQSMSLAADVNVSLPFLPKPVPVPLDAEVTLSVKGSSLILRPVGRMLLLGRFNVPSAVTLEAVLATLKEKFVASMSNNALGFLEFAFPIDLVPRLAIDASQLSSGELTVAANKFDLPFVLRPVIVIGPETLWILSEARIQ